jgi:hypothetical protein
MRTPLDVPIELEQGSMEEWMHGYMAHGAWRFAHSVNRFFALRPALCALRIPPSPHPPIIQGGKNG